MEVVQEQMGELRSWMIMIALNAIILSYFGYAFMSPASSVKASLLPGKTTHGHYQIELDCAVCHQPSVDQSKHSSQNVMQDACIRCHGSQLEAANDTHPAKKFNDPSNADQLATLDAQNCLTCHREHVPDQTTSMGLSVPTDYCWHCHQDVAESRPSHAGMKFDSCATAGCHNYHDNRAIYEKYLYDHHAEPDFLESALLPQRRSLDVWREHHPGILPLAAHQADGPPAHTGDGQIVSDWVETAHANAGVNCSDCHLPAMAQEHPSQPTGHWVDQVEMKVCQTCHAAQVDTFLTGKHGMRLAIGMSPMTTDLARLPMQPSINLEKHSGDAHQTLTCNACHSGHRFDTAFAAVQACQNCHADTHSVAYADSSHASLWQRELAGELPEGSGVTCATCHLPRITGPPGNEDHVWVNHDQNAVLRPNEMMARQVCSHCHGLEFSLSSLADPESKSNCYGQAPGERTKSVTMAHEYFEKRLSKRRRREQN